ncbi:GmrSD restriction endonuclease domain-containing protein [Nocardia aurea]|uniref:GmrSD restriction endonuclease domain-containing protein n=1 Tax=Nocardia aurea TaxID=2144174 RepID=UPI0033BAD0D4
MAELNSQPRSIQSIYSLYSAKKLFVNRRYQRKLVWTLNEKQKFVESILRKYPVPAILLAERLGERDGGELEYEVIDGLQRLHTIVSFIECAFPSLEERYFDVSEFATAKGRADRGDFDPAVDGQTISRQEVSTYLDYVLAVSVMQGATEREIDDVFGRINTYGHRLSDQERRQAGVQDEFSNLVRELACEIRGDASSDILNLEQMPAISIDLPMTKHGYEVIASDVFWVEQGILLSTDLRDSMDEQCLADIAASVVGGQIVERSKDALDKVYDSGSSENIRIADALSSYGTERISDELKYCIDEVRKVCSVQSPAKLRNILFDKRTTNAFPAVFAILLIAFHESLFDGEKKISDYAGVRSAISNLNKHIDTSRRSTAPDERRKNIEVIKGLIARYLVDAQLREIYGAHSTTDIDVAIRRSEIELPHYELKQGLLDLSNSRAVQENVVAKVVNTVCAMANSGPDRSGTIIIGVTDKKEDADKIRVKDKIEPRPVGRRFVVGVKREADRLKELPEVYFSRWKNAIRNSELSENLKAGVLSNMDYNDYFGLGVIVIRVPAQTELSYVGDDVFWREGDSTLKADSARTIAMLAKRFG